MRFLIALGLAVTSDVLRAARMYHLSEATYERARKVWKPRD